MSNDRIVAQAVKAQRELVQAFADIGSAMRPQLDAPGMAQVSALGEAMARLVHPVRSDDLMDEAELAMELLRTWEVHGDGLHPYTAAQPSLVGDVLIGSDRSVWVVTAVDDKSLVREVAGTSPKSEKADLILTWRPATTERAWLQADKSPAPAYTDINQAMTHLVRLWSDRRHEGRDLSRDAGFLLAILEVPGIKIRTDALSEISDDADIAAFCEARGGLSPADQAAITVGDILRLDETGRTALVVRAATSERPGIDLLVGRARRKGALGEAADAVQLLRDYRVSPNDTVWRPAELQPTS